MNNEEPFAKLMCGTGRDKKIGLALEAGNEGCGLFLLSIPEAFPYGLLPGDPREFRARVAPTAILPDAQVQAAIDTLVELGLYHRYEADGHVHLYVRRYHRYQPVNWSTVRPSPQPLPECWEIPEDLRTMIDSGTLGAAHKQLGEHGIMGLAGKQQGSSREAREEHLGSRGGAPG